jgi:hypothetical protein
MSAKVGNYQGDYPDRGAKHEATQDGYEDDEDAYNMEDDDFVDQDYIEETDFAGNCPDY